MIVAVCRIEMFLPESTSLKAKRSVLNSYKARIRNKFNVSVSEIDHHDKWQRIALGIAMITNEHRFIDQTFTEIIKVIQRDGRVEILDHCVELY